MRYRKLLKIGRFDVSKALGYLFDGCHKFYIAETQADVDEIRKSCSKKLRKLDERIYDTFCKTECPLLFISSWNCKKQIVPQFAETATFVTEDHDRLVYRR